MITIQSFLKNQLINTGAYALVSYNGTTEAIYFQKILDAENGDWFLESPCQLIKIANVEEPVDIFAKNYIDGKFEEGVNSQDYINTYIKPMIIDGVFYENFQCAPYLPKEVDNIKIITERECLIFLLSQ